MKETIETGSVTSRDGVRIGYAKAGSGRPLVLVHGGVADHNRWLTLFPALGEHTTVYAIDRRGRGLSGDAAAWDIEREFDDVAAVVDSFGEPVDLFGHSFGGACALEAALRARHLRRLIVYEAAGMAPPAMAVIEWLEGLLRSGDRESLLATFFRDVVGMPEAEIARLRLSPAWPGRLAAAHTIPRELRAFHTFRLDPARYSAIRVPALLLVGSASAPEVRAATEALAQQIPDARVTVLEGQRHIAMDTAPQLVSDAVLGFVA